MSSNKHQGPTGRRRFLRQLGYGVAGTAAAWRFVPLLDTAHAHGTFPKRLIIINSTNGIANIDQWRPTGSERDFDLSPILEPLAPFRDRLLVIDGVDNAATYDSTHFGHHGTATFWTGIEFGTEANSYQELKDIDHRGWANGPSVDQVIADRIGEETRFPSIQLGVRVTSTHHLHARPFWAGARDWLPPITSPRQAFERMFGDFSADGAELERLQREQRSVLDGVTAELGMLRKRLGRSDRDRLGAHLEGLRELEGRLGGVVGAACEEPDAPPDIGGNSSGNIPEATDLHMSLIASAFACDLTRVATFQLGREGGTGTASWLGHSDGLHRVSHNSASSGRRQFRDWNVWQAQQVASLLSKLQSIPEGDETLLDHTLVVWGSQISTSYYHSNRNTPVVVYEGRGHRHFDTGETGRWVRFGDFSGDYGSRRPFHAEHGGEPMNKVLVSLCHAMGLTDIDQVGHPRYGNGPLPRLV